MCYLHLWSSQTSPVPSYQLDRPPHNFKDSRRKNVMSSWWWVLHWWGIDADLIFVFSNQCSPFFCSPKRTVCAPRLVALCGASLLFDQGNLSPRPTQKHQHLLQSINVLEMKGKIHCVLHLYKYILQTAFSWAHFFLHLATYSVYRFQTKRVWSERVLLGWSASWSGKQIIQSHHG